MNDTSVFSKSEMCWKSIETEAVFTKTEMNNERNVDFLQNTKCVEKVSRLKLYLPRQKWTMNEKLIFFKIRGVLKKYRDWSCIYQDRNEQCTKRWFSSKYEVCWKSIETEAVFTTTEMNNERKVDFLQNTRCVEKVSRLKLYLSRQKWTMNETLIFFKIRSVFKKNRDWSCIYQDRNQQWMKRSLKKMQGAFKKYRDWSCIYQDRNHPWIRRWLFFKMRVVLKIINNKDVFTKTEMNIEWNENVIFQNSLFLHSTHSFQEVFHWPKHLSNCIVVFLLVSYTCSNWRYCICTVLCNTVDQKLSEP